MRLLELEVIDFGAIQRAKVGFGPGLNVLFGPNDLGKSTLAAALRAVLLIQPQSSAARQFVPWSTDRSPSATLTFELEGRTWRVHKTWSSGSARTATLEWSNDGKTYTLAQEGRAVDGELRNMLGWGIPEPGGKGGKHGLPRSFLSSVLLGEQALPYKLFERSLADDPEDSGRERLTEVLQAMATDPLFADVLGRVQGRVDEAFTQTGRKKQSKTSPFKQVADEIRRRSEVADELEHRVGESEAVARRLRELDEERDRQMTLRAEAAERLEVLQRDLKRRLDREASAKAVADAKAELDEIEQNRAEIEQLAAQETAHAQRIPELETAVEMAERARADADAAVERARQALVNLREGGDAEAKLKKQTLEAQRLTAQSRARELEDRLARAEAARVALHEATEARTAAQSGQVAEDTAAKAQVAAQRALEELEASQRHDRAARLWLDASAATEALQRAEAEHRRGQERVAKARELRQRAAAIRAELERLALPDGDELSRVQELAKTLELARARLGGGVSVRVAEAPEAVRVVVDEQDARTLVAGEDVDAQRQLAIEVAGARLEVVAGEREARAAVREAETRWESIGHPILARAQAADVPALRLAVAQAEQKRREADHADEEAAGLEEAAASMAVDEAELKRRSDAMRAAQERLSSVDLERARDVAALDDVDTIRSRMEDRQTQLAQAREQVSAAGSALAEARAGARVALERLDEAEARAKAATEALDGDPAAILAEGKAEAERLLQQGQAIEAELAAVEGGSSEALQSAQAEVAAAESNAAAAKEAVAQARAELEACRDALSSARGQLSVRREQAGRVDALAAAERYAALQDALAKLPEPEVDATPEAVQQAQDEFERADRALDEALAEVRKQEGALQQVGGQVVRERFESAREALEAARRRQSEVELEYDGWRLLLDTLREAENEEGQHLGRALGQQVGERFEELTQGRYGALELGPELEARGVGTRASGLQNIESLSEGLKEQLATILRILVAQHLEVTLLLDDHLTQTDPGRVAWFRDLLRTAAQRSQIIVLTCRESDYLTASERPEGPQPVQDVGNVHAVALQRVIERS